MVDVNLTGQVAANLVQNPIMIVSASAIGGLIAGGLTLLGVIITQKREAQREEKIRKEEARRTQREERKKAYIQFFAFTTTMDSIIRFPNNLTITLEEIFKPLTQTIAEIALLSPEIADHISEIIQKHQCLTKEFSEYWENISNELKISVFPLMRAELNNLSSEGTRVQTKHWWQLWRRG